MSGSNQVATTEESSQTTISKKQSISWSSSMVAVHEVEFHKNSNEIWYQQDELKAIRKEIRDICSSFCMEDDFRGLEAYMDPSAQRSRTQRRREVTLTVLEEQQDHYDQQEQQGGLPTSASDESIAELYHELSALFIKEAQARGVHDQEAAEETYQEEEEQTTKKVISSTRTTRNSFSSRAYDRLFRSVLRSKRVR